MRAPTMEAAMAAKLVVGAFAAPETLLAAVKDARAKGFAVRDVYTPFPVHGMDEAMALPPSPLSKVCLLFALTGLTTALGFQYWVSLFDWPMNIGGKAFSASPALLPIAFELTVLFAGLGTVGTLLVWRGLLPGSKPAAEGLGATDSAFLLALELPDEGAAAPTAFLKEHGASRIVETGGAR